MTKAIDMGGSLVRGDPLSSTFVAFGAPVKGTIVVGKLLGGQFWWNEHPFFVKTAGDFGSIWGKFTIIKQPSGIRGIRRRECLEVLTNDLIDVCFDGWGHAIGAGGK